MRLSESAVLTEYNTPLKHSFDFYRCYKCNRLFTREQEKYMFSWMTKNPEVQPKICSCGSMKYSPSWPTFLGWIKPSVIRYVFKLVLAREIAPWMDGHYPGVLPYIEWLVKPKEA